MKRLIYAADDELNIRNLIKIFLENAGYAIEVFESGDLLLERFKAQPSDLVILDIMMPGRDGFEICSELRKISSIPIIMLTARNSEIDYITGLSIGSDDYFTKPFSPMSLVMRVQAIFRRIDMDKGVKDKVSTLDFMDLVIKPDHKTAAIGDKNLDLTPTEFDLIRYLTENKHRAVSRAELLNKIWGYDSAVETRVTDDTVKRVRKKLMELKSNVLIETIWGYGFKLVERILEDE